MKYSLASREVIADSIETVVGCQGHDALIAIGGCDKNMPACIMAMARLNRPALFIYGGTIQPGKNHTDIVSVFEAVGAQARGDLRSEEHTSELQSRPRLVCRLLLEKKKIKNKQAFDGTERKLSHRRALAQTRTVIQHPFQHGFAEIVFVE